MPTSLSISHCVPNRKASASRIRHSIAQLDRQEVAKPAARQQAKNHAEDAGDQEQRITLAPDGVVVVSAKAIAMRSRRRCRPGRRPGQSVAGRPAICSEA